MGLAAEELRITLTLSIDEVHWPQVLDLLGKRHRVPFRKAGELTKDFFERFLKPFNLYWFAHPQLSSEDNRLLSAVCECHGADVLVLTAEKPYRAGPLRLSYAQQIEFHPNLRNSDTSHAGTSRAEILVGLFGRTLRVDSFIQTISIYLLLSMIALLAFVVVVGAFMYALAVFLLFLEQPLGVTEEATGNAAIGLALLSFLVASSAIFGRAVSNVTKLLYGKMRARLAR